MGTLATESAERQDMYREARIPRRAWQGSFLQEFPSLRGLLVDCQALYATGTGWPVVFQGERHAANRAAELFTKTLLHKRVAIQCTDALEFLMLVERRTWRDFTDELDAVAILGFMTLGERPDCPDYARQMAYELRRLCDRGVGVVVSVEGPWKRNGFGTVLAEAIPDDRVFDAPQPVPPPRPRAGAAEGDRA